MISSLRLEDVIVEDCKRIEKDWIGRFDLKDIGGSWSYMLQSFLGSGSLTGYTLIAGSHRITAVVSSSRTSLKGKGKLYGV